MKPKDKPKPKNKNMALGRPSPHTLVSTLLVALLVFPAMPQMTYKAKPLLPFLRKKFEKKLSTNYYMNPIITNQETFPAVCSASLGPHCSFLNNKNLNHLEEKKNRVYIREANKMMPKVKKMVNNLAKRRRKYGDKAGDDLIFMNEKRLKLDQILFPKRYPRILTLTFSFESFELGNEDTLITRDTQARGSIPKKKKNSKKSENRKNPKNKANGKEDKSEKTKDDVLEEEEEPEEAQIEFKFDKTKLLDSSLHYLSFDFGVRVSFKNIWLPAKSLIRSSRAKIENSIFPLLVSDKTRELVRFGKRKPEDKFAMTKTKPGHLKYSVPLHFHYLFVKRNHKYSGESYVAGKLRGETKFNFTIDLEHQVDWRRIFLQNLTLVDEISLGPFLKLDNIQVRTDYAFLEKEYSEYFRSLKIKSIYGEVPEKVIPSPFSPKTEKPPDKASSKDSDSNGSKENLDKAERIRKRLKDKFGQGVYLPDELLDLIDEDDVEDVISKFDALGLTGLVRTVNNLYAEQESESSSKEEKNSKTGKKSKESGNLFENLGNIYGKRLKENFSRLKELKKLREKLIKQRNEVVENLGDLSIEDLQEKIRGLFNIHGDLEEKFGDLMKKNKKNKNEEPLDHGSISSSEVLEKAKKMFKQITGEDVDEEILLQAYKKLGLNQIQGEGNPGRQTEKSGVQGGSAQPEAEDNHSSEKLDKDVVQKLKDLGYDPETGRILVDAGKGSQKGQKTASDKGKQGRGGNQGRDDSKTRFGSQKDGSLDLDNIFNFGKELREMQGGKGVEALNDLFGEDFVKEAGSFIKKLNGGRRDSGQDRESTEESFEAIKTYAAALDKILNKEGGGSDEDKKND